VRLYAGCCYAVCHIANCHYAECRILCYAECPYSERFYAKYRFVSICDIHVKQDISFINEAIRYKIL
jgi:hypothetical protein